MKPFEITGYVVFLIGIVFKFLHFPGAAILMLLGSLFLLLFYSKRLIKKEDRSISKNLTGLAAAFWAIYLLFRIQYWSYIVIPMLAALGFTIAAIQYRKAGSFKVVSRTIVLLALFAISAIAAFTPTYFIYYLVNLNEPMNENYRKYSYTAWNKYSWFLYKDGEIDMALEANEKAFEAAKKSINEYMEDTTILTVLINNKQDIMKRSWNNYN